MELLDKISVGFAIIAFLGVIVFRLYTKKDPKLENVVIVTFAAYALPKIIVLIVFPFFPSMISSIQDMKVQLSIMGLILLFVNVKTIIAVLYSRSP